MNQKEIEIVSLLLNNMTLKAIIDDTILDEDEAIELRQKGDNFLQILRRKAEQNGLKSY